MAASTASTDSATAPIPRGDRRRREIAIIAERVFLETGFAETTMQSIAARAGASKETLYRHFGSKEELFAESVASRARVFLEDLDERFDQRGSVADVLRALGLKLLEMMTGADAISLCRIVVAEGSRNPELGRIFMTTGPDRVRSRLAEFLRAAAVRGELHCADPESGSRIFLGAVMTNYHLSSLILQAPLAVPRHEIERYVDEVVETFMCRYKGGGQRP